MFIMCLMFNILWLSGRQFNGRFSDQREQLLKLILMKNLPKHNTSVMHGLCSILPHKVYILMMQPYLRFPNTIRNHITGNQV